FGRESGLLFRRFGSEVTVVHRGDELLSREDPDVASELKKALEAEGVRFLLKASATRVAKQDGRVVLTVEAGGRSQDVAGSHLLVATGRRPNTDDLGLDAAGVEGTKQGVVQGNNRLGTNGPRAWALGDATVGPPP